MPLLLLLMPLILIFTANIANNANIDGNINGIIVDNANIDAINANIDVDNANIDAITASKRTHNDKQIPTKPIELNH